MYGTLDMQYDYFINILKVDNLIEKWINFISLWEGEDSVDVQICKLCTYLLYYKLIME